MTTPPAPTAIQSQLKIEDFPIAVRPEDSPLLFVDGFQGLAIFNDAVRINAYQISQNIDAPESLPYRVFVTRLAMSPATAFQLMKWLQDNLQAAGVAEVGVPPIGNAP